MKRLKIQKPVSYTHLDVYKRQGRPSTYAPILATIIARNYVTKEKKAIFPTELGEIIDNILKEYFPDIVNVGFTAEMESELDKVEEGKEEWKTVIRAFYPHFDKELANACLLYTSRCV